MSVEESATRWGSISATTADDRQRQWRPPLLVRSGSVPSSPAPGVRRLMPLLHATPVMETNKYINSEEA